MSDHSFAPGKFARLLSEPQSNHRRAARVVPSFGVATPVQSFVPRGLRPLCVLAEE